VLVAGILDYPHWKSIPLFNLDGIALGCALAAALQSGWALPFDRARRQVLVWVLVALAALDVLFADHWDSAFHDAREVAARLLFVGILAVVVVDRPPLLSRVLRWRVLTFLGSISYALYLWHTPLREILSPERIDTVPRWALSAASLGGAVAIATLSLHLVERPVLAWRRRPERSGRPLADAVPAMRQVLPASATAGERGMIGVGGGDEH
jgi:peptidoglycan/LPS O-acetylase OafA/YrhL